MKLSLKCQVWIAKAALSCWLCTYSKGKRFIGGNQKSRGNSPSNRCRILQCHDMIGQYGTPCGNQSHLSRNGRTMSNIDFRFYSKSHAPKARWLKSSTLWALTASTGACSIFIGGNKKSRENSPSNRCRILQCHDMIGQYRTPCGNQSHLSRNGRTMSNIDFRFYSKSHAPKARWLKSPTLWALTASAGACSSPQMTVTISVQTQRRRM